MNTDEKVELSDLGCNGEESLDDLLDLAIALKDEGRIRDSARVHMFRLSQDKYLARTEGVRLLGEDELLSSRDCEARGRGIFHVTIENVINEGATHKQFKFKPLKKNVELGRNVREIFWQHGYSLRVARAYLLSAVAHNNNESGYDHQDRIFSANSFFFHRHEVLSKIDSDDCYFSNLYDTGLSILLQLFLFGLSVDRRHIVDTLGETQYDMIMKAGLMKEDYVQTNHILAEVQIFPISLSDLHYSGETHRSSTLMHDKEKLPLLVITDWPMESLRPSKTAVMPIGYDSLELCAISSFGVQSKSCQKVLDLCCGSGIQGMLFWINNASCCELVLNDINKRACKYAIANIVLNSMIFEYQEDSRRCLNGIHVFNGNLFDPLSSGSSFDRILCNPPFVSLPCDADFALYAASGEDGLDIVHTIVSRCFDYLKETGKLLVITEVPNVEESCDLIMDFIPMPERSSSQISIAYVENDVELIEEYTKERSEERGMTTNNFSMKFESWSVGVLQRGIRNRALILLSLCRCTTGPVHNLYSFTDGLSKKRLTQYHSILDNKQDEEDMFLTKEGIKFVRESLLT